MLIINLLFFFSICIDYFISKCIKIKLNRERDWKIGNKKLSISHSDFLFILLSKNPFFINDINNTEIRISCVQRSISFDGSFKTDSFEAEAKCLMVCFLCYGFSLVISVSMWRHSFRKNQKVCLLMVSGIVVFLKIWALINCKTKPIYKSHSFHVVGIIFMGFFESWRSMQFYDHNPWQWLMTVTYDND